MPILGIGVARFGKHFKGQLYSTTVVGFGFLLSYTLILCSHPTIAATDGFNKLFTHNRTKSPFDDTESSFFTRLRDLTAAAKKPSPGQANRWSGTNGGPNPGKLKGVNKQPQFQQTNKGIGNGGENKKNKGSNGNRKPKPTSNYNANHNYYASSYAIPKYPVDGVTMTTVFTPTVAPTRIHPLAILKTEIKAPPKTPDGVINYSRSALDDLLGAEDQEGRSSEVISGPAADTNFFKNFRDHSEDPMADESGGPSPVYARPDEQRQPMDMIPASASAPSAQPNTQFRHPINGQYSGLYDVEYNHGGGQGQGHSDHKNVNYWPQKLNSYYGDDYLNQLHPNKKRPGYPQSGHMNSFGEFGDEAAASTNALRKVTMIDRISTLYTDYKFLAWVGIVVLASLAALIGLLVLYWRNPPTEVVTARTNLARKLTDPTLLIFVSEALRKFGDKEKIEEKPGGPNRLKRRRLKTKSVV